MEVSEKNKGGRPTKYKPEFKDQARKLCLLGFIDTELAEFFEVDVATLNRWKNEHPGFCDSLNTKALPDANVVESLYKRAIGYSHPDTDIRVIDGRIVKTKITKHYPPDTMAAMYWLNNRQPKLYRNKNHLAIDKLTDEQVESLFNELKENLQP